MPKKSIVIIGGGPSALMLAAQVDSSRYEITLYDQKKTVGRKFLVAGEGGLNLTFNAATEQLKSKYFPHDFMAPFIRGFNGEDLRTWLRKRGVDTFAGSSNRVFPLKDFKPVEVLNCIIKAARDNQVVFRLNTKWEGWNAQGDLCFANGEIASPDIVVYALGGASWQVTGSDGAWRPIFEDRGIRVVPFSSANCAFQVNWNKDFLKAHEGKPLKNIALRFNQEVVRGELAITRFGLEGNALYAHSRAIQKAQVSGKNSVIYLDLKPTMTVEQVKQKLAKATGKAITQKLKNALNLDRTSIALLKHFSDRDTFFDSERLAQLIKTVLIPLGVAGALDEAISTLGGIHLDEVDEHLGLKQIPGHFAIGEMLDWFAPTGGYLLQGCFSMGYILAQYLNRNDV